MINSRLRAVLTCIAKVTKLMNSYSIVERINSQVNASVSYKTDLEQYGKPEHWVEADTLGDCEDYALLKRQQLLEVVTLTASVTGGVYVNAQGYKAP